MARTEAASRGRLAVLPRVQLSLPPLSVSLSFFSFSFFFVCFGFFVLLPVCVLTLEIESFMKSLALPEPHFSLLGSGTPQRHVWLFKTRGFTLGCLKLWSNFACPRISTRAFEGCSTEAQLNLAASPEQGESLAGVCRLGEGSSADAAPCR